MPGLNSTHAQQVANAIQAIRSYDSVVVVGAGMSAYGFPMTSQLPAILWQAVDATPEAIAALRASAGVGGSAKEILQSTPALASDAWALLRDHPAARLAFQNAFARLDNDREPSPAHVDLARLIKAGRVNAVISFNWDTQLERAFARAYGVSIDAGVLFKPHGDAAQPSDPWVFPDEAGVVPSAVVDRIATLSGRPRTLVTVGYSGSDEAVVEQLLAPLAARWPVVSIGPSATGEGAVHAPADLALSAIVEGLGADAPLRGWRYVSFERRRDFSAALRGERLRPTDVDACPEMPAAARLESRLRASQYATISGASGSGKSITAFHAARRLNRAGWAIVELSRGSGASQADLVEFLQIEGPVLAVVDDAQSLEPDLLSMFRDAAAGDHAVLLVSTERLEERDDETLMAEQTMERLYEHCIEHLDLVGPLISQLDDRVRVDSNLFESPRERLDLARRGTKEPWQFMFVASGGERRIESALDRIVESPSLTAVFAGICIEQLLSRDDGVSRDNLLLWLEASRSDQSSGSWGSVSPELVDDDLQRLMAERLIVERDGKLRATHARLASRALEALGLRPEHGSGARLLAWVRAALVDSANSTVGKLWLYRSFERRDAYRFGPGRPIDRIIDPAVIEAVVVQLEDSPRGLERGAGLNLIWAIDFDIRIGEAQAGRLGEALVRWFDDIDPLEVNGFHWVMSALRSSYGTVAESVRAEIPAENVGRALSTRATRRSAMDWARLLTELSPKMGEVSFDTWTSEFDRAVDVDALSSWLSGTDPDSHPFEIYDLIGELAALSPRAAEVAVAACGPNIVQAFEADFADATSNMSDWAFGIMYPVARYAGAATLDDEDDEEVLDADQSLTSFRQHYASLGAQTLGVFQQIDWGRSARTLEGKRRHEIQNVDIALFWLGTLDPEILDRIAEAVPFETFLAMTGPDANAHRDFRPIAHTLFSLSASPGAKEAVRAFLSAHESDLDPFPEILIRRFPQLAAECAIRGQALANDQEHPRWDEVAKNLVALEEVNHAIALSYLAMYRHALGQAILSPSSNWSSGLGSAFERAALVDEQLVDDLLRHRLPEQVEAPWRASFARDADGLRPILRRAARGDYAVSALARRLLEDDADQTV